MTVAEAERPAVLRILFPMHGLAQWNGGIDFIRQLASGLSHPTVQSRIEVTFALPRPSFGSRVLSVAARRWAFGQSASTKRIIESGSPGRLMSIAEEAVAGAAIVSSRDSARGIVEAAEQCGADIIFPTMTPLAGSPIPQIGYVFDFQHRHLPQLFSARTRRNRDRRFDRIATHSDGLMVTSRMAARDAENFLGLPADRILVLPFAPYTVPWRLETDPESARVKYGIDHPYLMISNQFWIHKDHETALRAFALFAKGNAGDFQLVCTGDPFDHRNPKHFHNLQALCKSLGITARVRFLGLIPKPDQIALLRGSHLLIQPTLFEGDPGGGSVYDAIGLGVPTLVSDIEVNREIEGEDVTFFRAGDLEDLARGIERSLSLGQRLPKREELLAKSNRRLGRLGQTIVDFLATIAMESRDNKQA